MGRRREETNPRRFLQNRNGMFHYKRHVPKEVAELDDRAPAVRKSLHTSDLAKAMALRDIHERADNDYWASLVVGSDSDVAMRRYKAAVSRATALGFSYRSAAEIAANEPLERIVARVEKAMDGSPLDENSLLGLVEGSYETISKAVEFYFDTIVPDKLRYKSEDQRRRWKNKRRASVRTFISLCGDKRMNDITREDAQAVHAYWMAKIAPTKGAPSHSASTGNRDLGNLRTIYADWFKYFGQPEVSNPFDGLSFSDKSRRTRPPFSVSWIKDRFLTHGHLVGMNREQRGIFLTLIETGARLSEICNLKAENIMLGGDVPYIVIEPSFDPEDPREIKTVSSVRSIPLVGVSLAAMKANPKGFPRYRDRGSSLSATINKFLRTNKLLETPKHTVYCLRHSFEDRMKDGRIDDELRRMLMGHAIDRPKYGVGGSLEWRRDELKRIALPFDQRIV